MSIPIPGSPNMPFPSPASPAPLPTIGVHKPRLLDLFCKQGGAGMGYYRAGFDVVGVDVEPQPRYPFEFHQAEALAFLDDHASEFDAYHASPPCQLYTLAHRLRARTHPDLIGPVRDAFLRLAGAKPWVIENVPGAPLRNPVMLCGTMFEGLRVYRHRIFESNIVLRQPEHPRHTAPLRKMGRPPEPGEFMHVVGNFSGVSQARQAMGIDWMSRDGLREAIPPAFTRSIGKHLLDHAAFGQAVSGA
ncbi:DNA cytosine methyltransferase [Nocardia goodfellowii]|uniref:DNA (Cytosine-5)-methyltransferase 1 n=1 Tax=Nocardia goodfellowii TaxID=882446 RepID=A0ABS4QSJ0_9NOCA|nr:DNA cytosine methyltransferase [Nocardia goodfellowii]MBP2193586.1 DNA (cytosine-5)-methyltransferase 1 [Nocardia goodfellowii]